MGTCGQWLDVDLQRLKGLLVTGGIACMGLGWMVADYFLVEYYLYSLGPALVSLPGNILQAVASLACGLPLTAIVRRSRLFSL